MEISKYSKEQLLEALAALESKEVEIKEEEQVKYDHKILVGTRDNEGKIHQYRVDAEDYAEAMSLVAEAMREDFKVKNPVTFAVINGTKQDTVNEGPEVA